MRTWQRSATAWIGVGGAPSAIASETRSLKSSSGAAAQRSGSAPSTRKFRSGMRLAFLQAGEEATDLVPGRLTAREPSPVRPDETDELVTFVDADAVTLTGLTDPV